MKKTLLIVLLLTNSALAVGPLDAALTVGSIINTTQTVKQTNKYIENENKKTEAQINNINAQTECIKSGKCTTVSDSYSSAQDFDPNSPAAQMGLKLGESIAAHYERKNAKAKLKELKKLAEIENDTQTLELIKKYKKAGPVVTLQKINELNNENK